MAQPRNEERTRFDPAGSIERHRGWPCNATSRSSDAADDAWSLMRAHVEDADPRTRGVARSPLIDDCYDDGDTSAATLKRLRKYLRSR